MHQSSMTSSGAAPKAMFDAMLQACLGGFRSLTKKYFMEVSPLSLHPNSR